MRALYDNVLDKYLTSISGTDIDANFGTENLYDQILQTECRTVSGVSDTKFIITLSEDRDISALAVGNHNLNTMDVEYFDNGDVSLGTDSFTKTDLEFTSGDARAIQYVGPYSAVAKIEVTCVALTNPLYIGGLWFSQYLQYPAFDIEPSIGIVSTSGLQKSRSGASFPIPGFDLETFGCNFKSVRLSDYNAINAVFRVTQNDNPIWLDRWEDSDDFPPLYCTQTNQIDWTKYNGEKVFDDLSLTYEEIR